MTLPIGNNKKWRAPLQTLTQSVIRKRFVTGFTLLELLIVVCIISITLGLSLPLFRKTFTDMKLNSAVQDMVSVMRYAQERAVVENAVVRFNADESAGSYWLTQSKNGEENGGDIFTKVSGNLGRQFTIPEDVTMEAENGVIDFSPDGELSQEQITLTNMNKKSVTIVLAPGIGSGISLIENARQ